VRARLVMVSPVVWRADVLHPLRRVPEAIDTFIRSAGFEHENGSVRAVQQAPRDHATRPAGADQHRSRTSLQCPSPLDLTMNLNHGVSLLDKMFSFGLFSLQASSSPSFSDTCSHLSMGWRR